MHDIKKKDTTKDKFLGLISKYSDNHKYNLDCWTEIKNHYSSRFRYYHNLEHIENMLLELEKVEATIKDLDTVLFAIYYHDIIYKSTKSDNEHKSALLFEKRISKTSFPNLNKCKSQIEATKEHQLSDDYDTNILLDLDSTILGKSQKEYQKYSADIRMEYKICPDFMYRKGRAKVLKNMLEKDSIYKTDFFKKNYENQAKENLRLELNQLN